jgi:hypothetical protein
VSNETVDCIIARAPCCKRLVFASVNDGRKMELKTKREIAQMAIDGYSIEHMTVADVRKADWGCECKKVTP